MDTTMGKHALHSNLSSSYASAHNHGKNKVYFQSGHGLTPMHNHGKTRATFKSVMVLHPYTQPWENTRYIQSCHGLHQRPARTTMGKHALHSKLPPMGKHAHNHGKTRATFKAVIVLHQCALPWETHAKFKAGMVFHPWTRPWENTRYIQICHRLMPAHTTMGKTSSTFKAVMVFHPWARPWENARYIHSCHGLTPTHTPMGKHALHSKLSWSYTTAQCTRHVWASGLVLRRWRGCSRAWCPGGWPLGHGCRPPQLGAAPQCRHSPPHDATGLRKLCFTGSAGETKCSIKLCKYARPRHRTFVAQRIQGGPTFHKFEENHALYANVKNIHLQIVNRDQQIRYCGSSNKKKNDHRFVCACGTL